jgi:hypothetical protein
MARAKASHPKRLKENKQKKYKHKNTNANTVCVSRKKNNLPTTTPSRIK